MYLSPINSFSSLYLVKLDKEFFRACTVEIFFGQRCQSALSAPLEKIGPYACDKATGYLAFGTLAPNGWQLVTVKFYGILIKLVLYLIFSYRPINLYWSHLWTPLFFGLKF